MEQDPIAQAYFHSLKARQVGGGGDYPVFSGSRNIQYGQGFGDVLRGFFQHVIPVVARGAITFLSEFSRNKESGVSWKDAAKSAIHPTAMTAISEAVTQIDKARQSGKGKRKRHVRNRLYKGKHKRSRNDHPVISKFNF